MLEAIGTNAQNVFRGTTLLYEVEDPLGDNEFGERLIASNDAFHGLFPALIPQFLPEDMDPTLKLVIALAVQAAASPVSGVAIGMVGPVVSPAVAALKVAQDIIDAPTSALQTLAAAPAEVTDAFLNGASLDLSALLPVISGVLPEGLKITTLDIAFGGLFTPGSTGQGEGIGGSMLNSLGMTVDFGFPLPIPAQPVGPLGAVANLSRIIGTELGWDGEGNPLTDLSFPTIDTPSLSSANRGSADLSVLKLSNSDAKSLLSESSASVKKAGDSVKKFSDSVKKAGANLDKAAKNAVKKVDAAVKKVNQQVKSALSGNTKKASADAED